MIKQNKIWGDTAKIFGNDNFQIHRIFISIGGYCSLHSHKSRWNMFYVEKGRIEVEAHKLDYEIIEKTIIKTGEATTIPPGEKHRFRAIEDSVVYEIYYQTPVSDYDIQRDDVGGK